jgi:hypothetical protein
MSRGLSEQRIRSTYRELLAKNGTVSGRGLREELRTRFGAAGKTERVFRVWREEAAAAAAATVPLGQEMAELKRRLVAAERAAAENLQRAERAEYREEAHQERWALEVDRLRQAVQQQPNQAATIRALQSQVLKLTQELVVMRDELAGRSER